MPRKPLSQWDFGELFPPEATRKTLSVSELTSTIKKLLEKQVGSVWVSGEITNLRAQSSGHLYFTLKDAGAQLSCVLFRGENVPDRHLLKDGQKAVFGGELTVYEPRGQYQLRVSHAEFQGVGALQAAFERLKMKLAAEGLFATDRKRPLPRYPQRIGLVTSATGAAVHDVLHVIRRRQPGLEIILVPVRVQGQGSAEEIAAAVGLLNDWNARRDVGEKLDLILVTRGGGSLEDLWAFNEEVVARAVFESALPVVSAVGHEIDFTIVDFVADLRAATPTAAAEIITEGPYTAREWIADASIWLARKASRHLQDAGRNLESILGRLGRARPRRRLDEHHQRLDDLINGLGRAMETGIRERTQKVKMLAERYDRLRPGRMVQERIEKVGRLRLRLEELSSGRWERSSRVLEDLSTRLRLLSPEQVLSRGYSITTDAVSGRVIRDVADTKPRQKILTRLAKGSFQSVIKEEKD